MNRWTLLRVVISSPFSAALLVGIAIIHPLVHGTPLDNGMLDQAIYSIQSWCYGGLGMGEQASVITDVDD